MENIAETGQLQEAERQIEIVRTDADLKLETVEEVIESQEPVEIETTEEAVTKAAPVEQAIRPAGMK